jgi:ABC-type antimicrobial peptide transport system permease subunit
MFAGGDWSGGHFWNQHENEREALRPYMFLTGVFTSLGGLGLILASVGMYGVLAYAVGQRMREFGIRIALGAETQSVFRLVIHDAAVMILAGTAIGCWFAMLAGNVMIVEETSVIPPTDWIALVVSEAVLIGVCFVAAFTPAIRASRANPLDIIRAI